MKKTIAFSILLLMTGHLMAEEIFIDLSEIFLKGSPFDEAYFIDEVIDARKEKYCLGFAHKGLGNKKNPVFSQAPLEKELLAFFSKTLTNKKEKEALSVRINHLFIYEVIYQNREYAFAELNISFYKKEQGHYVELLEVGTAVEKVGMEVTKHHPANIANAISECLKEFKVKWTSSELNDTVIDFSSIEGYDLNEKKYPVFAAPEMSKGVYKTFNDFRFNRPAHTTTYEVEYYNDTKKGVTVADLFWEKSVPKKERKVWGFCDGTDNFMRVGKSFYKIKQEGKVFKLLAPKVQSGSSVVAGVMLGGVIGGMVGSLVDAASVKYQEYNIDFVTGNILPIEEPLYRKIESRILLCSSRYSKKTMQLKIGGDEKCTLNPGEYMKLSLAPEIKSVELCVETDIGETCENLRPKLFLSTVYVLSGYKKKTPKIDHPNKNILTEIISDIKSGKFISVCEK